jgi:hypothetical protein
LHIAGMGTLRRVHDRVGAVVFQLVRRPVGNLAPLVLGVPNADRIVGQSLIDRGGAEEHLDGLPVALVLVVPVVVVPVDPVLHCKEAGPIGLLCYVGVHG